jgi:hypothetical protein
MAGKKMLILRGNSDTEGKSYPDEKGKKIPWPDGALHRGAAEEYAGFKGYKPVVLDVPGQPQSQTSPQAKAALKLFLEDPDQAVTAFYGFSGGGYNLYHILQYLATNEKKIPDMPENNPDALHRIDLVVVFGAPKRHSSAYDYGIYNNLAKKNTKVDPKKWTDLHWDLVYRINPKPSALPKSGVPENVPKDVANGKYDTHMFGPEVLLAEAKDKNGKVEDYWQPESKEK